MRPALLWLALSLMGPLVALVAIWYGPIAHYWAGPSRVTGETLERARAPLPQGVGPLLAARDFDVPARAREGLAAAKVRRLQATGELQLAGFAPVRVDLPFEPANLDRGTPGWRLQVVSLVVPRLLLDAYRETGDRRYLVLARDAVLAWARYEADRWLPRGMLWNDHAVAARIFVLADFWQAYRQHPELMTRAQARRVLAFAGRGIALTARPAHYNPRTNHGILQDLALWHAHLAFPGLPTATAAARVARERFGEHLPYYLGPDGVILEHSAGYHEVGVKLVGRAFRYMDLAGQAIPEDWWRRYERAIRFLRLLRRPDGTLPRLGDTKVAGETGLRVARRSGGGVRLVPLAEPSPAEAAGLYPVAGYWVGWRGAGEGGPSQTVLTWSHFAGHGHKHADELSLLFWADAVDWWTAAGYWPYGVPGREAATAWGGANAPHLAAEPPAWERSARLLGHAQGRLRFLDLRRRVPSQGYRVRRQLIGLAGGTWAVLDSASGGNGHATEEVWRTGQGIEVASGESGGFRLTHSSTPATLAVWHAGFDQARWVNGGQGPGMQGFLAGDRHPIATNSLILKRPSDGAPSLLAWRLGRGGDPPRILGWQGPERWRLRLPGNDGSVEVTREGRALRFREAGGQPREVAIVSGPDAEVKEQRADMARQLASMQAGYGQFRSLLPYRERMTVATGGLLAGHLVAFFVAVAWWGRARAFGLMALAGWLVFSGWLTLYYFRF